MMISIILSANFKTEKFIKNRPIMNSHLNMQKLRLYVYFDSGLMALSPNSCDLINFKNGLKTVWCDEQGLEQYLHFPFKFLHKFFHFINKALDLHNGPVENFNLG